GNTCSTTGTTMARKASATPARLNRKKIQQSVGLLVVNVWHPFVIHECVGHVPGHVVDQQHGEKRAVDREFDIRLLQLSLRKQLFSRAVPIIQFEDSVLVRDVEIKHGLRENALSLL